MVVGFTINFRSSFGQAAAQAHFLFASADEARAALDQLHEAAKAYHDRANDREKLHLFEHMTGSASVDVSEIVSMAIDDALGENRDLLQAWNIGIAQIHATAKAAGELAAKSEPSQ